MEKVVWVLEDTRKHPTHYAKAGTDLTFLTTNIREAWQSESESAARICADAHNNEFGYLLYEAREHVIYD